MNSKLRIGEHDVDATFSPKLIANHKRFKT